MQNVVYRGVEA